MAMKDAMLLMCSQNLKHVLIKRKCSGGNLFSCNSFGSCHNWTKELSSCQRK